MDYCAQDQGHSEGLKCQWMFVQIFSEPQNILLPNLVWSQWGLIWSKCVSLYFILWTVDSSATKLGLMVCHHEPECLVGKKSLHYHPSIQVQSHSKGSNCQSLSRWYLLNCQTFCYQTLLFLFFISFYTCYTQTILKRIPLPVFLIFFYSNWFNFHFHWMLLFFVIAESLSRRQCLIFVPHHILVVYRVSPYPTPPPWLLFPFHIQ